MKSLLLAFLLLLPAASQAEPPPRFAVLEAATTTVDGVYLLDAELQLDFGPAAMEALTNGIPLTLELEIEVLRERDWWLDETVAELRQRYVLSFHPLSRQYLIINLNTQVSENFPSIEEAVGDLTEVKAIPILDRRLLFPDERYWARLRARLDLESLPAPLRLWAYISPAWHLQSDWYAWMLNS